MTYRGNKRKLACDVLPSQGRLKGDGRVLPRIVFTTDEKKPDSVSANLFVIRLEKVIRVVLTDQLRI